MILYLVIAIGLAAVSSASILIKLCDAPSLVIATYRLGLAALFFVAGSAARRRNPLAAFNRSDLRFALLSGAFLCLHFATWITSLRFTSVTSSTVLVATSPVFVAFGSLFFLKEKIAKLGWAGICLTVIGAGVLSSQDSGSGQNPLLGNLLALAGAVGAAGYLLTGRKLRIKIDTLSYVSVVYSTTALLLLALTLAGDYSFIAYEPKTFVLFFLIAFVPQVIGHTCFNWMLEHLSAATVNVLLLGEPVGAAILAFYILGEKITAIQVIGGMLILTGVVLALRGESARKIMSASREE